MLKGFSFVSESIPLSGTKSKDGSDRSISPARLGIALLCPLFVVLFSWLLQLKIEKKIIVAVLRTMGQLFFAGYILLGFIFSMKNPFLVFGYLLFMSMIAALEATSRQVRTYSGHFLDSLISIIVGGLFFGIVCSVLVFSPDPFWAPEVVIPTTGTVDYF